MSKTAISIMVYSIYLGTAGICMALIPNVLLHLLGHPTTNEVWVRLFGILAAVLGVKGIHGARNELLSTMQVDVVTRTVFSVFLTVLVVMGIARPILLLFAVIDFVAAIWTQTTIWKSRRS